MLQNHIQNYRTESSSCGLSSRHCRFHEWPPRLPILCSMIGSVSRPMLSGTTSDSTVRRQVWRGWRFQSLGKGVTLAVVHGCISTCKVAKELTTSGTNDVCEWQLVSSSAHFSIRNVGPRRTSNILVMYDANNKLVTDRLTELSFNVLLDIK